MPLTLIVITQTYLKFSSTGLWDLVQRNARIVLVVAEGEAPLPRLAAVSSRIEHVAAIAGRNVTPILDSAVVAAIIEDELTRAAPADVRLICQDEANLLTVALCRERFGIPGDLPEMVKRFRDKIAMKQSLAGSGVRVPEYAALDKSRLGEAAAYYQELSAALGPKLVLKPRDAAGSLGVKIVGDENAFIAAMHDAAALPQFEYEVDAFITGGMYQCDSFTLDGEVVFTSVLELNCSNFEFVGGVPLAVFPLQNGPLRTRLVEMNKAVIAALGFSNGATHHELFLEAKTQEPVFLEIAARAPGGIGVPFHFENSGVNLIDLVVLLTVSREAFTEYFTPQNRGNVVYALLPLRRGKIVSLDDPDVESQYEISWNVKPGAVVDPKSLVDSAGILVLRNPDAAALRRDFERLNSYSPVRTAPLDALAS